MGTRVVLAEGRKKSVRYRHPWIFSGGVARVEGSVGDGEVAPIHDAAGACVGRGFVHRHSQIAVRVVTWDPDEEVDDEFWRRRLAAAVARRGPLAEDPGTDAYRLVHAEADGLPGLIADRYGDVLVLQLSSAGVERLRDLVVAWFQEHLAPRAILHRSDPDIRKKESLTLDSGPLVGDPPAEPFAIHQGGVRFLVDPEGGHKTGFYLDQRLNRGRCAARLPAGGEILDACCYSGAFAVEARAAGASRVTLLDSSSDALALARRNLELTESQSGGAEVEFISANAFEWFRGCRDRGRSFDAIVLDPPKLAPSRSHLQNALRAYKDLNLHAMKLVRPGGVLATFSCSGAVRPDAFQTMLFHASLDANREVQLLEELGAGDDHPVLLSFPESRYLCGAVLRVL